ncbi:hypothetical protein KXV68_004601 [Aspergillus fumigatus]|nr:hypothetical protein KXX67_004509 [Aspergillus fumigatus]KAH1448122.1 hypothetical protein KXX13_004908 [Aspergillus fumigatus]KAH1745638.1 hypothetical protein KXX56_004031 [Aspergillus fumigatus]KAH2145701.1 hypothetical protein KXV68_004601 [Aspergillus fumigatus]KAH2348071.1 hypothetical protein KXW91_004523 [Aspergillus fumigatus]
MRFTQLLIAAGTASLALAARLKSKTKRTSVFQFGSNESGAEFGSGTIPGVPGKDCIWLNTTAIGIMKEAGTRVEHLPCAISHGASSTTSLEALMRCTWLVWSLYGEFAYEYYLKVFGAIFSKVELYGNVDGEGDCYGDCFEYELDNRGNRDVYCSCTVLGSMGSLGLNGADDLCIPYICQVQNAYVRS